MVMLSVFRIIEFVVVCWAVFAELSLLSRFRFLVDGVRWLVADLPILLDIGKWILAAVADYRHFVRGLTSLLYIPPPPSAVYDALGVIAYLVLQEVRLTSLAVPEQTADTPLAPTRGHMVPPGDWQIDCRRHHSGRTVRNRLRVPALSLALTGAFAPAAALNGALCGRSAYNVLKLG
jgi:hypothetical protein